MSKQVKTVEPLTDVFTGEEFFPINGQASGHYEVNDGVPVAPPVNTPRLSLRERINRLVAGGADLSQGIYEDDDPTDWSDDDADPLTPAEQSYIDQGLALERQAARIAAQKAAGVPSEAQATSPSEVPASPPGEAPNPPADGPRSTPPSGSKSS